MSSSRFLASLKILKFRYAQALFTSSYMEFNTLIQKAKEIKEAYEELNIQSGKKLWGASEYAQGLTGDVGDLSKLLLALKNFSDNLAKGKADSKDIERGLRHELADCLWSIMIIAEELGIDLEKEFMIQMEYLEERLREKSDKK